MGVHSSLCSEKLGVAFAMDEDEQAFRVQKQPGPSSPKLSDLEPFDVDMACGPAGAQYLSSDRAARRLRRRARQLRHELEPTSQPSQAKEPRGARDEEPSVVDLDPRLRSQSQRSQSLAASFVVSIAQTLRPCASALPMSERVAPCVLDPFVTLTSSFLAAPERGVGRVRGVDRTRRFTFRAERVDAAGKLRARARVERAVAMGPPPHMRARAERDATVLSTTLSAMHSVKPAIVPEADVPARAQTPKTRRVQFAV
eukprot:Amastigsp_a3097_19.p1 type:complete len:256 gc:universal Amastigsp_a3097_19:1-768(+)